MYSVKRLYNLKIEIFFYFVNYCQAIEIFCLL